MRQILVLPILLFALASPGASTPTDVKELLQDVSTIAAPGVPGPLCVFGKDAFPVVTGQIDKGRLPVVAAARWDRGRVVVLGHTGYFSRGGLETGDTGRFLRNALRWTSGGRQRNLTVTCLDAPDVADFLSEAGVKVRRIPRGDDLSSLSPTRSRVLVVGGSSIPVPALPAVRSYVRSGGGLITASLGWGWLQLNPGRSLIEDHPGNRLLLEAGIVWADGTLKRTGSEGFDTREPPSDLAHANRALTHLLGLAEKSGRIPEDADRATTEQASLTTSHAVRNLPHSEPTVVGRIARLRRTSGAQFVISEQTPLTARQGLLRALTAYEAEEMMRRDPGSVPAHPSSVHFPGKVRDPEPTRTTVEIDLGRPRWHSTGAYAIPGRPVRARVPENARGLGLELRIGAHKDRLWHKPKWDRFPEITRTVSLDRSSVPLTCAFGGLVYVVVPDELAASKDRTGKVAVSLEGIVPAPPFTLGETSVEEWRSTVRRRPAPWAELQSDTVILTVPSEHVRELERPDELLHLWNRISDACRDLLGRPTNRRSPERFVADVQISAGYMHAGYPIMTHLDAAPRMTSRQSLLSGSWGLYHELGHNHQDRAWTFGGTGEVTCNLFTLYIYEKICGIGIRDEANRPDFRGEKRQKTLDRYRKEGARFEEWKRRPFLALLMYIQLREAFGWEPFRRVFAGYPPDRETRSWSDEKRRDEWMIRFSRATGRNLGPFFEWWGVPTSRSARSDVRSLSVWLPEELERSDDTRSR